MSTKINKKRGITRRDFIKWSAAAGAAGKALDWSVVPAGAHTLGGTAHNETTSICPYCSVGCGMTVAANLAGTSVLDIYGDKDHVISRGALCSKGAAAYQLVNNTERVTEPRIKYNGVWYKHNSGAASGWTEIMGNTTVTNVNWIPVDGSAGNLPVAVKTVPKALGDIRTTTGPNTVAFYGSSHMTNEECYLYRKFVGEFGTNNIEHQARL